MDRIVERLVRLVTLARRRGDDAGEAIAMTRLLNLSNQPGFMRSLDRALNTVDWSVR